MSSFVLFFAILIGPIHPVPTSKVMVALFGTSKYKCNTHNERTAQVRIPKKAEEFHCHYPRNVCKAISHPLGKSLSPFVSLTSISSSSSSYPSLTSHPLSLKQTETQFKKLPPYGNYYISLSCSMKVSKSRLYSSDDDDDD